MYSSVSVSSTCYSAGGWGDKSEGEKVSALKEFIILRWQSCSLGSRWGEEEGGEDGGEEGNNTEGGVGLFMFVWLLVISQKFIMGYSVGWQPLSTNQSPYCLSLTVTCCLWLCLNYEKPTHTDQTHDDWSFGGQKYTLGFIATTKAGSKTHIFRSQMNASQNPLASGMRETAFNSIKPSAVCLGPSVQSIVLLFGSPLGDSWCMGSHEDPSQALGILPQFSTSFSSFLDFSHSIAIFSIIFNPCKTVWNF